MRLFDDDELYQVDQTYLGPPGRYIAPMRHKAIFAWLILGPLSFVTWQRLGLPFTVLTVGLLLLGTVWAAMSIADHATGERPIGSLLGMFWHELTARRAPTRAGHARIPCRRRTRRAESRGASVEEDMS